MVDNFMTWEALASFTTFTTVVFMVVEFTKELPCIKKIPTRYWSFIIAFLLLFVYKVHDGEFAPLDLVLYALSAMAISLGSNGLYTFNKKDNKQISDGSKSSKKESDKE